MSIPIHEQLSAEFRARIASGVWPEGRRAPSEAALCDEFGVSRGPVRQALSTLRAEGLLVGGRGRSPLVRRTVPGPSSTVLGSFTAWADAEGHRPGQHTLLHSRHAAGDEVANPLGDVAATLEVSPEDPVVTIVRVRTLDDEPAVIEHMTFSWEVGRLLMEFDPDSGSINRFMIDRGVDLYSSSHRIDAVAATERDAVALGVPEGAPLIRARRLTRDAAGRPVETAEDRYVPGLCAITVENRLTAADGALPHIRLA
ncbi:GntR family transcriptional regulator [Gordonia shandongensis]|uniref:GntR family transcriptional regulator n=1 Tax=Gordonia shandongensis TaxID=376351 RepID=UPI00047B2C24|nr:GntR family transcriptional regulator [Gordonia shandongensis]